LEQTALLVIPCWISDSPGWIGCATQTVNLAAAQPCVIEQTISGLVASDHPEVYEWGSLPPTPVRLRARAGLGWESLRATQWCYEWGSLFPTPCRLRARVGLRVGSAVRVEAEMRVGCRPAAVRTTQKDWRRQGIADPW